MSDLDNPFGVFGDNDPFGIGPRPSNIHAEQQRKAARVIMTPERRLALHDACAAAIRANGTVKLTATSAAALSGYLCELETLLQHVLDSTTLPDNLRRQIEGLPIPR